MSHVASLFGGNGSGDSGAQGTTIISPVTKEQAEAQNQNVQDSLKRQQDFVAALNAQNGIANQSNVFNQLQGVAAGTGPNPAQAMLSNATGANIANQASLMAGQRGASANAGLIARQAAIQGGNIQQQAAGQGAAMQANQSMQALNAMGNLATNQVSNLSSAQNANAQANLGAQQNLLNSISGVNNANVAMQSNINNANASLASGAQTGQQAMFGNIMGALGTGMQMFGGGAAGSATSGGLFGAGTDVSGGSMLPATGGMGGTLAAAEGGEIVRMADGGLIDEDPTDTVVAPQSQAGQFFKADNSSQEASSQLMAASALAAPQVAKGGGGGGMAKPAAKSGAPSQDHGWDWGGTAKGAASGAATGTSILPGWGTAIGAVVGGVAGGWKANGGEISSKVPALVSPGEKYLSPQAVQQVKQGANPLAVGETIPGKPVVGGAKNDYANDTVRKDLDEGGIVLPRSVTKSKDAQKKADAFVQAILAKHGNIPKRK